MNAFDQFGGKNAFDQFDTGKPKDIGAPQELTFMERVANAMPDWMAGSGGGVRGSAVGRLAMGAADPGVALFQIAANAVGQGDAVNQRIADVEKQYQDARAEEGSTGFDPLRMAGNVAMTLPVGAAGKAATTLGGMALKGAAQGAAMGGLSSVTEPGDFAQQKLKQIGMGAAGGAVAGPIAGALARVVSPAASTNPNVKLLQAEGVKPTVGQTLGGWANAAEEKAQSLPIVGDMIRNARQAANEQFRNAAYDRAGDPIGATVRGSGYDAVGELSRRIGKEYEAVLPKMQVNVLDQNFVQKMARLRGLVQNLPQKEAQQFDAILSREIDNRVAKNGVLSGQNFKDAWIGLREAAQRYSKSTDGYQQDLADALKQAFQELKDHATSTNPAANVAALRNADFAWANFKRVQKAAGSVGAEEGNFSPAQLNSAVKAMDRSKDKARFGEGKALMQDLSRAGKATLSGKVPDSGTAGRVFLGGLGLASGVVNPAIPAALGVGAAAYTPQVQNVLRYLLTKRPDLAPALAEQIRRLAGPASLVGADFAANR